MDCIHANLNLTFPTVPREPSLNTREICTAGWYDYEGFPGEIMEPPLYELFFTRSMIMLNRPDGFMLYGKLVVHFFSNSELLYPNLKTRLPLIRATPNFYLITDNPDANLGIGDCSLYTCPIALKDDYHKKRMDMLA